MYCIGTIRPRWHGVLGRGITAVLVAMSLVGMSSLVTASDGPHGFGVPVEGGLVELPDSGFALTFPHDWTAYEVLAAGEAVLAEDPLPDGQTIVLVAFSADEDGMCEVILDEPTVRGEPSHLAYYSRATEWDMNRTGFRGDFHDRFQAASVVASRC